MPLSLTVYSADWCPDCRRLKDYLNKHEIAYDVIDVDVDKEAAQKVEKINNGKRIIPTVIVQDGSKQRSLTNPNNEELAQLLGMNPQGQLLMYSADWCPDCRRAKQFLRDNKVNFQIVDVDKNADAAKHVESINNGKRIIPTIELDGQSYTNPNNAKLRELFELDQEKKKTLYDVAIIGGGAAGLTAAIYATRDHFSTIVLEKKAVGGNAALTERIDNYPGFTSVSGQDLMDRMAAQAKTYGADIETGIDVKEIKKLENGNFIIDSSDGDIHARSIIIASGSSYRRLKIPGEQQLIGGGVHFCATCDGAFYRDQEVIVVGGGNSALEEAIFLAGFVKKVTIVHRGDSFKASQTYQDKLPSIENITVHLNATPTAFIENEDATFKGLEVDKDGTSKLIEADGAFIFVGLDPNTKFLNGIVKLNENGFIQTGGCSAETSLAGIFAAGDCRVGAVAQVAAATGDGVVASYAVRDYLSN